MMVSADGTVAYSVMNPNLYYSSLLCIVVDRFLPFVRVLKRQFLLLVAAVDELGAAVDQDVHPVVVTMEVMNQHAVPAEVMHMPRPHDLTQHSAVKRQQPLGAEAGRDDDAVIDMVLLEKIVVEDEKQRYSFNEDMTLIRANQGHSIPVDVELEKVVPPEKLYHGTGEKYTESIEAAGLIPKSRLYVHLS